MEALQRLPELQRRHGKLVERHYRWQWKWRTQLQSGIYYDLLKRGFIKPADEEPDISGFELFIDAFGELNTSRPVGFGLGPIPFTAAHSYFTIYELDMDFEEFLYVIRRLDRAFLDLNEAENNKGNKTNGSSNANKKNPNKS